MQLNSRNKKKQGQKASTSFFIVYVHTRGGSVAEWLVCWTQAQKGQGSNRSREAVGKQS